MLRKQVERPAHGVLSSLVPCCNKGQHLVMDLLICHSVSLVLRLKQHGEHISHIMSICTALPDQVIHECIQRSLALHHPTITCKRKIETQSYERTKCSGGICNYSSKCLP